MHSNGSYGTKPSPLECLLSLSLSQVICAVDRHEVCNEYCVSVMTVVLWLNAFCCGGFRDCVGDKVRHQKMLLTIPLSTQTVITLMVDLLMNTRPLLHRLQPRQIMLLFPKNRKHKRAQQQVTFPHIQVSPPPGYSASPPQCTATCTWAAAAGREQGHRHTDNSMHTQHEHINSMHTQHEHMLCGCYNIIHNRNASTRSIILESKPICTIQTVQPRSAKHCHCSGFEIQLNI